MLFFPSMEKVLIKGKNFLGFEIDINENDIKSITKELQIVLASSSHLIKNTIVTLKLNSKNQLFAKDIINFLKERGISINAVVINDKNSINQEDIPPVIELKNTHTVTSKEEHTATYKGNLRNGQSVKANGDLVIVGNVNSNSYIYATGNIFVLGDLYGIPHAGYGGDEHSVVFAFSLHSPQIRIGDFITRSPEEEANTSVKNSKMNEPEVAYIDNNNIVINSYREWIKLKE